MNVELTFTLDKPLLRRITEDRATEILMTAGNDILEYALPLTPKEEGFLRENRRVRIAELYPGNVGVYASFGTTYTKSYAIPQELGAPKGNPLAWGHLFDLEYTTEGTGPKYLETAFNELEVEANHTLDLLARELLSKVP